MNAQPAADQPLCWESRMETRHFTFRAFGSTEEDANEAMGRTIARHAFEYDLPADWWEDFEISTAPIIAGGYRDDQRIDNRSGK